MDRTLKSLKEGLKIKARNALSFIRESNEKVKEIQRDLGRLGFNACIRNTPVRFSGCRE